MQRAETEARQLLQQQQAEAKMKQFIRQQQAEGQQLMPNKLFHFHFCVLLW